MASHQRTGLEHSAEHLEFINDIVDTVSGGSGPPSIEGWYARLFHGWDRAAEQDPIIADVHTDPGGVERPATVLHVGTALPRLMVLTVDSCNGPRAYVGPVFSCHEKLVEGLNRMTDSEWASELEVADPPDVPWMAPIVSG